MMGTFELEQIVLGEFAAAKVAVITNNISAEDILKMSYDVNSIVFYSFVISVLLECNTASKHELAADILAFPLSFYEGAYSVALFHAQKAALLDPKNIEAKTFLFLFYDIPERLLSYKDACKIAEEILKIDPNVQIAKDILFSKESVSYENKAVKLMDVDTAQFYNLLIAGKFDAAYELIKQESIDELFARLEQIAKIKQTLIVYGYAVNLLLKEERAEYHYLASRVLLLLLTAFEGYSIAAHWHAKKACELAPNNKCYTSWLDSLAAT